MSAKSYIIIPDYCFCLIHIMKGNISCEPVVCYVSISAYIQQGSWVVFCNQSSYIFLESALWSLCVWSEKYRSYYIVCQSEHQSFIAPSYAHITAVKNHHFPSPINSIISKMNININQKVNIHTLGLEATP